VSSDITSDSTCVVRPLDLAPGEYKQYLLPTTLTLCDVRLTITDSITDSLVYDPTQPSTWRVAYWSLSTENPNPFFTEGYQGDGGERVPYRVTFDDPVSPVEITIYGSQVEGNTVAAYNAAGDLLELWNVPYTPLDQPALVYTHTFDSTSIRKIVVTPGPLRGYYGYNLVTLWSEIHFKKAPKPPCPPTGDSLVDNQAVRDGLYDALQASYSPDSIPANNKEQVRVIVRNADGTYSVLNATPAFAFPCNFYEPIAWPSGVDIVAFAHTHPQEPYDHVYECPDPRTGDIPIYDPYRQGGGSAGDWFLLEKWNNERKANGLNAIPEYIIDKRNVYRMAPNVPWKEGPKHYKYWEWRSLHCSWTS
jgi:hypothetical protein